MRSRYDHLASPFKQYSFNYDDDSDTCALGSIKRMSYGDEISDLQVALTRLNIPQLVKFI